MPRLTAPDGTELAYHVRGEGDPLIVLPGGPMRASAYLGDLGGLAAHRRLILLDLRGTGDSAVPADPATYRCDRQVDDVEVVSLPEPPRLTLLGSAIVFLGALSQLRMRGRRRRQFEC